jgi:predicted methyltransferase
MTPWSLSSRGASPLVAVVALAIAAAPAFPQVATTPQEMHHLHGDPAAYIASLDDPARDAYQKPDEVMKALALHPGEAVADIGSGSGYFTLRFARAVGETGRVYGVDISPDAACATPASGTSSASSRIPTTRCCRTPPWTAS